MKIPTLRTLIREAISDRELSLELSNGKIIHGKARTNPKALSLQIGNNTYFYFWEGKFIKSGTGSVTIVGGVDDYSYEWFLKAKEEYLAAMHDTYPERFGPLKEDVAYKTASNNELAQYIINLSNELKAAKSHGDEKEIGYIRKDIAEVKAELESRKKSKDSEYKEVEKQMFDLKSAGKRNTPEYDKLIKRRAELEKSKMNEERNPYNGFLSTDDTKTVIIRSNDDWEKLATSLGSKGFKHQGSLNTLNPNKGLTQMSNYAKFPYEVEINKTQKLVDFGEHTLDK